MTDRRSDPEEDSARVEVSPGYPALQLARALTTAALGADVDARDRARERVEKWARVLRGLLDGSIQTGSRTPVAGFPAWVTLEVVTGGFATGEPVAGGPLQEHERGLLAVLPPAPGGRERLQLNTYYLSEPGFEHLRDRLRTGCYDVTVPEEGALMVATWLAENGNGEAAHDLLAELSPLFPLLRFYPRPLDAPRSFGSRVHVQTVGRTLQDLSRIAPNRRLLAQKEAVEVWAPFHDRVVALALETVRDGWPCRRYPDAWPARALELLGEFGELRREHPLCRKPERASGHQAQLRELLGRCARAPESLTGREVGRMRSIVDRYVEKRDAPGSTTCREKRSRQRADVSGPLHHQIAAVVRSRLELHDESEGLDDTGPLRDPVTADETERSGLPLGTPVPPYLQAKIERCLNETVATLVERGVVTSGDTLARVLPQMTASIQAMGIADPALRHLYASIFRAFRRRRSLLLLDLQAQVQMEELPWVQAIDRFGQGGLPSRQMARQTLEEVVVLALASFPQAILPNKLLQELRALAKAAALDIPLVDELAADIFMGRLSRKFEQSARLAGELLAGSLYATYYDIQYERLRDHAGPRSWWRPRRRDFAQLCAARAGVSLGTTDPASNGMIIEQQQILTTQNLAALFASLDLQRVLRGQLAPMARRSFTWVCRRLQRGGGRRHARLIARKNAAYAWRQMVFFLALLDAAAVAEFMSWAREHLERQPEPFRDRFRGALDGLLLATEGRCPAREGAGETAAWRFLGWSRGESWPF